MEKKSGISQRSVLRILHQHKFHPYRMSLHKDLYGNDFLKRVHFCNWIRRNIFLMVVAPTTPDDMKERIRRACTKITPQMLAEVRRSFHQRIKKCLQVEGHHFEHLL